MWNLNLKTIKPMRKHEHTPGAIYYFFSFGGGENYRDFGGEPQSVM
jgi:hypothetical protein